MGFARNAGKRPIAVVAIEIGAAEIVGDKKVQKAICLGLAPGTGEAVAIVVYIQARCFSPVDEYSIAFVMQQEIGGAISRVVVGHRVVILIETKVVAIGTQIDIE